MIEKWRQNTLNYVINYKIDSNIHETFKKLGGLFIETPI